MVKFNKVQRVLENQHHKETYRLEYLENNKLNYKAPIHYPMAQIEVQTKKYFQSRKTVGLKDDWYHSNAIKNS